MMNMILIIAVTAMISAAVVNLILTESIKYCNPSNKNTYSEMVLAGSVLMFLSWIAASQTGSFDVKWMHIIAIVYEGVFFFDVIETFRLTSRRTNNQRIICADTKKSAIVTAVSYFVFSYLVS